MEFKDTTAITITGTVEEVVKALGWLVDNATDYSITIDQAGMIPKGFKMTALIRFPILTEAMHFKMRWTDV